jgi:hypothetical protein
MKQDLQTVKMLLKMTPIKMYNSPFDWRILSINHIINDHEVNVSVTSLNPEIIPQSYGGFPAIINLKDYSIKIL